ncbi:outer membrane protein assembly factor BamA [Methyloversatilis sp.]|uniref:outer membrane protein assembly factor BamA n=1 Tax=Methyloversatilis sp. TaxID=2569862 RepID=UPI0027355B7E|nr:outer membrane protein assembly factor BamA [Methyloversatilis sp.]MDP2868648.1 outer membrane protein assembly factor BamA [Methyloversatilis sp.]MDP3455611.1 outer membrane protein assembly factor BamA [Methyloversatilis sp.]MDP3577472.1 outer membrane protein assembly factor BamA [Methyloversatilis sp.]
MRKFLLPALLAGLLSAHAFAFEPFVVRDIRVEGIQRTEAGTVFSYLPVKVGETFTEDKAAEAIKALFATGFFKDVRVEVEGDVLVVVVDERPAIASLEFIGMKEFDKDTIKKAMRDFGLAESRILDRSVLERSEQEMKRQYLTRGLYSVDVKTTTTPLERNRVAVTFEINEGAAAKIKQINIVGAKSFKEKDLLKLLSQSTGDWLSWYNKNNQYSRQKLSADVETLRSHYLDRGYLEFNVDSTQVSITPDKQDIYITISITEGEKYTVGGVKLSGELLIPEAELRGLVKLNAGDDFSRKKLTETTKAISDRLGNDGYAFANVNAVPEPDREKRTVSFNVFVDPGRRVYVRRINVAGNTKTRDEAVRREFRQMEGSWYDGERINRSKSRADRLGYFDGVTVETPAVPGTTDQVDVNLTVKEKPTGNLAFGAGFSSSENLILSTSVSQQNLFGSGKSLSLGLNSGSINKTYSLSFTDPYYTPDGISRGFDVYLRNVDPSRLRIGNYRTSSVGAGMRWGFPIREDDRINFGLAVDQTSIDTFSNSPQRYLNFVNEFGDTNNSLVGTIGWARDTRDSVIYPTKGSTQRVNVEVSLPPGSLRYYKASYQHQRYFPLFGDFVLMLNGDVGYGDGYNDKPLPFYKNYFAGGIGSVRGFQTSSLGERDRDAAGNILFNTVGGNRRIVGNAELLFPLPGSQDKTLRLGTFIDAGQVWASGDTLSLGDLRYSAGLSVAWSSPMGPLKFSVAQPLNKEPTDRLQRFQFQLGSTF